MSTLYATMVTVRVLLARTEAILGEVDGLNGLPSGARSGLERSIATLQNILEILDAYESQKPQIILATGQSASSLATNDSLPQSHRRGQHSSNGHEPLDDISRN